MKKKWIVGMIAILGLTACNQGVNGVFLKDAELAWKDSLDFSKTYDGNAASVSSDTYVCASDAVPTVTWKAGETLLEEAPVNVGTYVVTVSVEETGTYKAASISKSYKINKAVRSLAFPEGYNPNKTYDGQAVAAPVVATGINVTWYENGVALSEAPVDAGSYKVALDQEGDANHIAGHAELSFTIDKAPLPAPSFGEGYNPGKTFDNAPATAPTVASGIDVEWYLGDLLLDEAPKAANIGEEKYTVKAINKATDDNHEDGVTSKDFRIEPLEGDGTSYNYNFASLAGITVPEGKDVMLLRCGVSQFNGETSAFQMLWTIYSEAGQLWTYGDAAKVGMGAEEYKIYKTQDYLDMRIPLAHTGTTITEFRSIGGSEGRKFQIFDINFDSTAASDLSFVENFSLTKNYNGAAVKLPESYYTTSSKGQVTVKWYKGEEELSEAPIEVGSYKLVVSQAISTEYAAKTIELPFEIKPILVSGSNVAVDEFKNANMLIGSDKDVLVVYARRAAVEGNDATINVGFKVNGSSKGSPFVAHEYAVEETALTAEAGLVQFDLVLSQDKFNMGTLEVTTSPATGKIEIVKVETSKNGLRFAKAFKSYKELDLAPVADPVLGTDVLSPSADPISVEWYNGAEKLDEAPSRVGSYTLKVIQGQETISKPYDIQSRKMVVSSEAPAYWNDIGFVNYDVPAGCHSFKITIKNITNRWSNCQFYMQMHTSKGGQPYAPTNSLWDGSWLKPKAEGTSAGYMGTYLNDVEKTYTIDFVETEGFTIDAWKFMKTDGDKTGTTFEISVLDFIVPSTDPIAFVSSYDPSAEFNGGAVAAPVLGADYTTLNGNAYDSIEWYSMEGETPTLLTEAPRAAGDYKVKIVQGENSCEKLFTVSPIAWTDNTTWGGNMSPKLSNFYYKANCTKLVMVAKAGGRGSVGLIVQNSNHTFWQGNDAQYSKMMNDDWSYSIETVTIDCLQTSTVDEKITVVKSFYVPTSLTIYDMYFVA